MWALSVGLPGRTKVQSDPVPVGPVVERFRGELGPIVYRDEPKQRAPPLSCLTQDTAYILGTKGGLGHQGHALSREDVYYGENADRTAAGQPVVHLLPLPTAHSLERQVVGLHEEWHSSSVSVACA